MTTIDINGNLLLGVAAVISAVGASFSTVFTALTHRIAKEVAKDTKEVMRQTDGINSALEAKGLALQVRVDAKDKEIVIKDKEILDLKNGGTHI